MKIQQYSLSNHNGLEVQVSTFGARITSVKTPDRNHKMDEIILGYSNPEHYREDPFFMGSTVGPVANRISKSQFTLGKRSHQLQANEGLNHLHGGGTGTSLFNWERIDDGGHEHSLTLRLTHCDQLGNYPGNLVITKELTLTPQQQMLIEYSATTDQATPVSLSNHNYWNLSGQGTILDHHLSIEADHYLELNNENLPTGEQLELNPNRYNQLEHSRLSPDNEPWPGIDHYFIFRKNRNSSQAVARLSDPQSGRYLKLSTTAPGLQCYTGQGLYDVQKPGPIPLQAFAGLCLEPHGFPDATSHPHFPSIILPEGETYRNYLCYEFGTMKQSWGLLTAMEIALSETSTNR